MEIRVMTITFGFSLPAGPPKGQLDKFLRDLDVVAPLVEGHFESLWMTDHFFWDDEPTHEAWTVLAYIAARYPKFKVGPMVLGQSYRNPALLAKMGATLQSLSKGRFIMGIGAGWKEDEYRAYDFPYPRPGIRIEELEDTLEIMKRLWTEPGKVSYQGKHYKIVDAYCEPKPDPMIPILVGGGGEKTMMLAARFAEMWNLPDAPFDRYSDRVSVLRKHCETIGRDPASIRLTWFGRLAVAPTEKDAEALGKGRWTSKNAFVGTPAQVIDSLSQFVELGVDYFMFYILGLPDPFTAGLVLEDVLPKIG
jgi:alkanesulfonate monooxygenase SsuD/methylene tetrahydromethanopterin reductase-like flavin-dependent oxidoreductase (luciferase family)